MDPDRFIADLEAKPRWLNTLGDRLAAGNPFADVPADVDRVLLFGMGSSRYAASVAAHDLRVAGIAAVAEPASVDASWPPDQRTLVVAISASGESAETLDAVDRYRGRSPIVGVTNIPGSRLAREADLLIEMGAGEEAGGVACRTFLHTGLLLRALEDRLTGFREDLAGLARRVGEACTALLDPRDDWLPAIAAELASPNGVFVLAPAERFASAEQGALMLREGPRVPAVACETGDWAHVDVYLTKSLDYRAILFPGSRWDRPALHWLNERKATVVAVGPVGSGARAVTRTIRYRGDEDREVARYAEILVPELLAASWWMARSGNGA